MTAIVHLWAISLADGFLAGDWDTDGLRAGARGLFGSRRPPKWFETLIGQVLATFPDAPHTRRHALVSFVGEREELVLWLRRRRVKGLVLSPLAPFRAGPVRWDVPVLPTRGDLAGWLGVDPWALDWLADRRNLLRTRTEPQLLHYRCRWIPKSSGGLRLLETPKPLLCGIQRRILHGVLDRIPLHDAAHGFVRGRSVLTHAAPHVGQDVLIRMDLRDFFPSTTRKRVERIFVAAGYPERVASTLAGLCTTAAPVAVQEQAPPAPDRHESVRRLAGAHLPQGAPTSPALANLAAFGLDRRLAAAAASCGAIYTRYADDLAFSGGPLLAGRARWFVAFVGAIARDEGYRPHFRKTRIAGRGERQILGGVVVNVHPNVPRDAVDTLKAILHNCARSGPDGQNRDGHPDFRAHLLGRISWVSQRNAEKGARLRALFDRIVWP